MQSTLVYRADLWSSEYHCFLTRCIAADTIEELKVKVYQDEYMCYVNPGVSKAMQRLGMLTRKDFAEHLATRVFKNPSIYRDWTTAVSRRFRSIELRVSLGSPEAVPVVIQHFPSMDLTELMQNLCGQMKISWKQRRGAELFDLEGKQLLDTQDLKSGQHLVLKLKARRR